MFDEVAVNMNIISICGFVWYMKINVHTKLLNKLIQAFIYA